MQSLSRKFHQFSECPNLANEGMGRHGKFDDDHGEDGEKDNDEKNGGAGRAVALGVTADRCAFYNCEYCTLGTLSHPLQVHRVYNRTEQKLSTGKSWLCIPEVMGELHMHIREDHGDLLQEWFLHSLSWINV
ncbi:unnamed protein product [Sphenostylis stenocarpa]|uniref:Uncharacterized protein n=1 Tax=Sphenostylis stenocarpa TaxID=92480 RepID=A0AA86W212_9FABA|nr:unnamed protein product [Sphenostylis stenocarpa]